MFDEMLVENYHAERMNRLEQFAAEQEALRALRPAQPGLGERIRAFIAALNTRNRGQQPRRRLSVAS
ncbi:MAG: hypothetical protein Kow0077_24510 [Anaerolineae bacterium]